MVMHDMRKIPLQQLILVYWLLVLLDLAAVLFGFNWLHFIVKPLLMPGLMLLLLASGVTARGRHLILAGLGFSLLGDVFLLFDARVPLFFIFGLVSFLLTHICYIGYFLITRPSTISPLKNQFIYFILVACYGVALVWILYPFLGALKIPVIIYAVIICTMLLFSIHIYPMIKPPFNSFFVVGALLFVVSDSLLALNKFYHPFALAGVCIMLTYCAAQYFIVMGFIGVGLPEKVNE